MIGLVLSGIVHVIRSGCPLASVPAGIRPAHDDLHSLQSLVGQGSLEAHPRGARRWQLDPGDGRNGLELREGTPLRPRRKEGKAQVIGPSRGGQTPKVPVLTGLFGRPAVIRLTAGNVSDIKAADEVRAGAAGCGA